nr:LRR receptor-like serine/threonine-protein kinase GSO2 [Tanacetum cinerariifolium]
LRKIDLSSNRLTGNLPNSIGRLSNLKFLDVSSNFLEGVVSDIHFLNLTQLTYLDLSFNSLALKLSSLAKIPFQLKTINLQSCNLGPSFPLWLKTQRNFTHVDISSAGISDSIPAWFWDLPLGLKFLNLSSNEIKGMLPDMQLRFDGYPGMDLSKNHLEGRIPLLPAKLVAINLSRNKFLGTLSFMCQIDSALTFLDLSDNYLSGTLPDCWLKFQEQLVVLNLCNNNLSGKIPSSLGSLHQLEALYLRGNAFVGKLPMSLSNLTKLRLLDVGDNKLSGKIPLALGELSELYVLILRSNRFYGSLPSQICWLNNLKFLDLSNNGFSGNIPPCFGNFTAMARIGFRDYITSRTYSSDAGSFLPDDLVPRAISYAPSGRIPDPCLQLLTRMR